jgi:hypothetical protein
MAILEGLVILTILLAAGYVGYHVWQDSMHEGEAEAHAYVPWGGAPVRAAASTDAAVPAVMPLS